MQKNFLIIDYDGWNIGVRDFFNETRLEFPTAEEAFEVARWWDAWISGVDL